jgi:hypothetical protein
MKGKLINDHNIAKIRQKKGEIFLTGLILIGYRLTLTKIIH